VVRRAFVLPMALVLLTILAGSLVVVAQRSAQQANAARGELTDLQRRWGTLSIQSTLLNRCDELLSVDGADLPRRDVPVTLGAMRFDLRIADENAKVNLTTAWMSRQADPQRADLADALQRIDPRVNIRLRPTRWGEAGFFGFDQVVDGFDPASAFAESVPSAITFWSDGRVRADVASDAVLSLIDDNAVRATPRETGCHSLWIRSAGPDQRWRYHLAVIRRNSSAEPRVWSVSW
jgi:hypothetical protein